MNLELGPVLRTLRRQPAVWLLVVFEIAAGVATISSLLLSGSWYGHIAWQASGLDEQNLIAFSTYSPHEAPGVAEGLAVETATRARQASDRARIRALSDVEAVTQVTTDVLDERWSYPALFVGTRAGQAGPAREAVGWTIFTDDGFAKTLGLPFISGAVPPSGIDGHVGDGPPTAVVLTKSLAEALFGSAAAALGNSVASEQSAAVPVIGVVDDVWMRMPFMPSGQAAAFLLGGAPHEQEVLLVVRARAGARDAVVAALRGVFASDATHRFIDVRAFDSQVAVHHRIGSGLNSILKLFGGMLGAVVMLGALATTSFLVAQRTRTIGIRRALGGTRQDIVGYFLLESVLATTTGSLLGVVGVAVLYRLMQRVFRGIVFDPRLVTAALVLLWLASILATLIPALRAARIPPRRGQPERPMTPLPYHVRRRRRSC